MSDSMNDTPLPLMVSATMSDGRSSSARSCDEAREKLRKAGAADARVRVGVERIQTVRHLLELADRIEATFADRLFEGLLVTEHLEERGQRRGDGDITFAVVEGHHQSSRSRTIRGPHG